MPKFAGIAERILIRVDDHQFGRVVRVGRNDLTIWCDSEVDKTDNPIVVHDVLIAVTY